VLEFTQLGDRWMSYLEQRRSKGDDLIVEFEKRKSTSS
jgi:hypothetical protein